jgi:hypothetical protein
MSSDDITPTDPEFSELSDQELDEIAGGLSFSISHARFRQSNFSLRQRGRGFGSIDAGLEAQNIESEAFQITVLDATTEDLKILGSLFGNTSAIEGGD